MVILTYHKINRVKDFENQLQYLINKKYNVISLSQFIDGFMTNSLTTRDLLLTFDDGDYSVLENALPVLKKYKCPAVMFVITSLIGTSQPFWWDEIRHGTNDNKQIGIAKLLSNPKRLDMLRDIRTASRKEPLQYRQLTWDELQMMNENGIAIANHSHTHPMFDKLSSEEIEQELRASSNLLQSKGFPFYNIFAYPNGNHTIETENILIRVKTSMAFLFNHKLNIQFENPLRISRLSINDSTPLWKLRLILSGWHSRIAPLSKALYRLMSQ